MKNVKILLMFVLFLTFSTCFSACDAHLIGLTVTPGQHDFGIVNVGDFEEYSIVITNISSTPIRVSNILLNGVSSFSLVGVTTPRTIQGSQLLRVKVKFTPTTAGVQLATMQIFHNGPSETRICNISGTGFTVPKIEITPTTHDFGLHVLSSQTTKDFDVTNPGTADLVLSAFVFTTNPTNFSIISGGTIPVTINPGATHTFTVEFKPLVDGLLPTQLEITHNAVNVTSPSRITISAEGTTHAPSIMINQTSPWDFGQVLVGATGSDNIRIDSNGLNDLLVSGASFVTGTDFSVGLVKDSNGAVITLPETVTIGDYIEITIDFSPTSGANVQDTLSIVHDGVNLPTPLNVTVEGSGRQIISRTFTYTGGTQNWSVPNGVTSVRACIVGGGGGGSGSHYGGGGSGYSLVRDINVSGTVSVTVGGGGAGGRSGSNDAPGSNGGSTTFCTVTARYGAGCPRYGQGGDGGSGGGGGGNSGYGGAGGSGGSAGARGASGGGGAGGHFDALTGFNASTLTAGAGGQPGSSSHCGGGGAGGVLINAAGPSGGDGGQSWSGKGGKGYGAGGGGGGYNSGTRPTGGAGAPGVVYIEY